MDKEQFLAALPEMIPEFCDPEVEFIEAPERIDARTWRGYDGVLESWTNWLDQFEDSKFELVSVEDHDDRVLVKSKGWYHGRASGAPVDEVLHQIFTFRHGKVRRYQEFYDEAAARAVLGRPDG
jgi:ketosteroid isomerase-like protein